MPFRIGTRDQAEHALGWLRPDVQIERKGPDDWVFVLPDSGEEHGDTAPFGDADWNEFLAGYPQALIRNLMPPSVRNGVWTRLVRRLILRGVVDPMNWTLEGNESGLTLLDEEHEVRAHIEASDWWYVRHPIWMRSLAVELINQTGLEPLSGPELENRFRGSSAD